MQGERSVPTFSADGSLLRREKERGGWGGDVTAAAAAGGNSTLLLRPRREKPRRICFPGQFSVNGIVRRGLYAYQLEHWLRFFPPEKLLVLNHEQVRINVHQEGCGGRARGSRGERRERRRLGAREHLLATHCFLARVSAAA